MWVQLAWLNGVLLWHDNETLGSLKGGEFLDWVTTGWLVGWLVIQLWWDTRTFTYESMFSPFISRPASNRISVSLHETCNSVSYPTCILWRLQGRPPAWVALLLEQLWNLTGGFINLLTFFDNYEPLILTCLWSRNHVSNWHRGAIHPEIQRPGLETGHSFTSSADIIKNA